MGLNFCLYGGWMNIFPPCFFVLFMVILFGHWIRNNRAKDTPSLWNLMIEIGGVGGLLLSVQCMLERWLFWGRPAYLAVISLLIIMTVLAGVVMRYVIKIAKAEGKWPKKRGAQKS